MNLAEANRILRLSDSQLAIVRQAAVPLSPSARDRYLKTVAAELAEGFQQPVARGATVGLSDDHRLVDERGEQVGDICGIDAVPGTGALRPFEIEPVGDGAVVTYDRLGNAGQPRDVQVMDRSLTASMIRRMPPIIA